MKVALRTGSRTMGIGQLEIPTVPAGYILVKVETVGICGSDLTGFKHYPESSTPDGHEYAGEVVKVGDGVSRIKIGDRVTADVFLNAMCGECEFCRRGAPLHCTNRGQLTTGGFAEYVLVKEMASFVLPESVDNTLGALVEPLAVAVHAVRKMQISPGSTGVIIGGGAIGLCSLIAAIDAGAEKVFVVAKHPTQINLALELGAADVLSTDDNEAVEKLMQKTNLGVDFAIEAVGGKRPTMDTASKLVRTLGKIGVVGAFEPGYNGFELFNSLMKEHQIYFSNCYGYLDGKHDFEVAIDILSRRGDSLRKIVTHVMSLDEIHEAFLVAEDKSTGSVKVHLKP
ncbi:zinc-dependent alcohol dehydrogenase [Ewingella americana]|nr:alcohol dehydrogenase catalytic domain-containing protein [Ewingella americana]